MTTPSGRGRGGRDDDYSLGKSLASRVQYGEREEEKRGGWEGSLSAGLLEWTESGEEVLSAERKEVRGEDELEVEREREMWKGEEGEGDVERQKAMMMSSSGR